MPQHQRRRRVKKKSPLRVLSALIKIAVGLAIVVVLILLGINFYVVASTRGDIDTADALAGEERDAILVLGAGIMADGSPSPVLEERLDSAVQLYAGGASEKIIVSGGTDAADSEISAMRNYLLHHDVPASAIISDHDGYNTYASVYNLKYTYDIDSAIIVSQKFHLYRALYIARVLDIDALGCAASEDGISDGGLLAREFFARIKDFCQLRADALPAPLAGAAHSLYTHLIYPAFH